MFSTADSSMRSHQKVILSRLQELCTIQMRSHHGFIQSQVRIFTGFSLKTASVVRDSKYCNICAAELTEKHVSCPIHASQQVHEIQKTSPRCPLSQEGLSFCCFLPTKKGHFCQVCLQLNAREQCRNITLLLYCQINHQHW